MDPFDTLGLPARFDLDIKTVEARYRELLKTLHPDKHVRASGAERRESLSRAVSVNDAYRVLRDDLKRAEALLVRLGGKVDDKTQAQDPELLMEVMELREALAEAKEEKSLAKVQALSKRVDALARSAKQALEESLNAEDTLPQDALVRASKALVQLRYYRRFSEEAAAIEEEACGL